jgi:excisionase family DNA binding protein
VTGLSRSRIYELIQSGDLETAKVGRATLVQYRSLKALTQS